MEVSTLSNILLPWGSTGPKQMAGEKQGYPSHTEGRQELKPH